MRKPAGKEPEPRVRQRIGWPELRTGRAARVGCALLGLWIGLTGGPAPASGQEAEPNYPTAAEPAVYPSPGPGWEPRPTDPGAPAPPALPSTLGADQALPPSAAPPTSDPAAPPVFPQAAAPALVTPEAVAARLLSRGFSPAQIDQAFQDAAQYGAGQPGAAEHAAGFRLLGLPWAEFPEFLSWNTTLTHFYNNRIGGVGQRVVGWVLLGSGLSALGSAALTYSISNACGSTSTYDEPDWHDDSHANAECRQSFRIMAGTFLVTAVVLGAVGIPLMTAGRAKTDRWAPDDLLDTGTPAELAPYALTRQVAQGAGPQLPPPRAWSLLPALGPEWQGLTCSFRF